LEFEAREEILFAEQYGKIDGVIVKNKTQTAE
jgi:hypothetical protein